MRKLAIAFLLATAGLTCAVAQSTDNMVYVKQFPGKDVGTKTANAMATCKTDTTIPCLLVIDPSLAVYSAGTMPSMCSTCKLLDWRQGPPFQSPYPMMTVNATACGYSTPPAWCTTYRSGDMSNVGDWINAAFGVCQYSTSFAQSTQYCHVTLDNLDGAVKPWHFGSTIHIPYRGVLDCLEADLVWDVGSATPGGVMVQYGSVNHSNDLGGGMMNCRLGVWDQTQGHSSLVTTDPIPTGNTVVGVALGGESGYLWHGYIDGVDQGPGSAAASTVGGIGALLWHNIISGTDVAIQGGNTFYTATISANIFYHNYHVMKDLISGCGADSGERTVFEGDFAWNQYGVAFQQDCHYELILQGTSVDYSNQAGLPGFGNQAEIAGAAVRAEVGQSHLEHRSGPVFYCNNGTPDQHACYARFAGTRVGMFQHSDLTATSSNCHIDGPYTVMGQSWNKATITGSNTFFANDGVLVASFTGQCSSLNTNNYVVNKLNLSGSSFWFYVPTSIAVTTVDDTSAGTFTVPRNSAFALFNPHPKTSKDYIGGDINLNGFNGMGTLVNATGDPTANIDLTAWDDISGFSLPHQKESTMMPVQVGVQNLSGCATSNHLGGALSGSFTAGATNCSVIIVPGFIAPNGFHCKGDDVTSNAPLRESAYSGTSCTITGTVTVGDVIVFSVVSAF